MSIIKTVNGSNYTLPEPGDQNWGQDVTDWMIAVSDSTLQLSSGSFPLTADLDMSNGSNFGLTTEYLKVNDYIGFDGTANQLTITGDALFFGGVALLTAGTPTKGNLIVGDGSSFINITVGTDGKSLVADSSTASGLAWTANSGVNIAAFRYTTTVGTIPTGTGSNTLVIGDSATGGTATNSVAIGKSANVTGASTVSIGHGTIATVKDSIAIGTIALAVGTNAIAIGTGANASIFDCIAIGNGSYAQYDKSISLGSGTAKANNSVALGYYGNSIYNGSVALSTHPRGDSTTGDTKRHFVGMAIQTTSVSPGVLALSGAVPLSLAFNSMAAYSVIVTARDNTNNQGAMWKIDFAGMIQGTVGSFRIIDTVMTTLIAKDEVNLDVTVTADTTVGGPKFTVTGVGGKTIQWMAQLTIDVIT